MFCLWPLFVDILRFYFGVKDMGLSTVGAWGSQYGYTIVNFVVLYVIGAYLRFCVDINNLLRGKILLWLCMCLITIFVWSYLDTHIFMKIEPDCAVAYNNPIVIALSVSLFMCFKKITFKSRFINGIAKAAFTCYLIHGYFIHHIKIAYFVQQHPLILLLHLFLAPLLIYIISWFVYKTFLLFLDLFSLG